MDKYLIIVLIFLIGGMGIALIRNPLQPQLFYSMLVGAIIIIMYNAYQNRKQRSHLRKNKGKN